MIITTNKIISELCKYLNLPIVPSADTENRESYAYIGYSIIALIADTGQGNISYDDTGEDIVTSLALQNKISFSFTGYARNEKESYDAIKKVYNFFRHVGVQELSYSNIAVVDVMDIDNRTVLEVNEYEHRYGCDVIVRYNDVIDRKDIVIEDYSINGQVVDEWK